MNLNKGTLYKVIVTIVVVVLIVSGWGWAIYQYMNDCKGEITHQTPTETTWPDVKPGEKPSDFYYRCWVSPFTIKGEMVDSWLLVTVFDGCEKTGQTRFKIEPVKPKYHFNSVAVGYSALFDVESRMFRNNIDFVYRRTIVHTSKFDFALGAGPVVQWADSKIYQVGARIEASGTF